MVEAAVVVWVAEYAVFVVPKGAGAASVQVYGVAEAEAAGKKGHFSYAGTLSPAREASVHHDHIYPVVPADADHCARMPVTVETAFAVVAFDLSVVDENRTGGQCFPAASCGRGIAVRVGALNDIDAPATYAQQSVDAVEFLRLRMTADFSPVHDESGRIECLYIEIAAVQGCQSPVRAAGCAGDAAPLSGTVEYIAAVRGGLVAHYGYALMAVEYLELRVAGLDVAAYAVPVPLGLREGGGVFLCVDDIVRWLRCCRQKGAEKGGERKNMASHISVLLHIRKSTQNIVFLRPVLNAYERNNIPDAASLLGQCRRCSAKGRFSRSERLRPLRRYRQRQSRLP